MMNKEFIAYLKRLVLNEFYQKWNAGILHFEDNILYKKSEFIAVYDLSERRNFLELKLIYDASNDHLFIDYKLSNNIVNDLAIQISIEKTDLDPNILKALMDLTSKAEVL